MSLLLSECVIPRIPAKHNGPRIPETSAVVNALFIHRREFARCRIWCANRQYELSVRAGVGARRDAYRLVSFCASGFSRCIPVSTSSTASKSVRADSVKNRLKAAIASEPKARAKVLTAALKVFRKKGLSGCSVEDLLQEGPVSRGSFYQYFQSKYDVAAALFKHLQSILVDMTRGVSAGERDPLRRVQNVFQVYMQLQIEIGWLYAMLLVEAKRPDSPMAQVREELLDNAARLIDRTLRDIQARDLHSDVYVVLLLAIEELTLRAHQKGPFKQADADHIRAVMIPMVQRALAQAGDTLLELPVSSK